MANYSASFNRLRNLAGNPELTCVKPRSEWLSVPAGYTFSDDYDAFVNGSGAVWKPDDSGDLSAADLATVPFLPGGGESEEALVASGLVDQGTRFGRVLPGDIATVRAAQWLELDGYTYDLAEATAHPGGRAMWYALRMTKR